MKKKVYIVLGIILIAIIAYVGYVALTPPLSPSKTTEFSNNGLDIRVEYSRPFKKERLIFGEEKEGALLPYGKYWRLGANEATEISFSKDINFAGQPINAGTYRMYAVTGSNSWQVSLNSELGKSGSEEPNYTLDVAKVEAPTKSAPSESEQFTINFSNDSAGVNMDFVWDNTMVSIPITLR